MMNLIHKRSRWSEPERHLDTSVFVALLGACSLFVAALFIQVITGTFGDDTQAIAVQQPTAQVAQSAPDPQP
jgi:hypothetical protein